VVADGPITLRSSGRLVGAGTVSTVSDLIAQVARDAVLDGTMHADGRMSVSTGARLVTGVRSQLASLGDMALRTAGELSSGGAVETLAALDLDAAQDLRLNGTAVSHGGPLQMHAGADLILGGYSKTQGTRVTARAGGDIVARAGGTIAAAGLMGAQGDLTLAAGQDVSVAGVIRSKGDLQAHAGGAVVVEGGLHATEGALHLDAERDLSVGKKGRV